MTMTNLEKARLIIEHLDRTGADLYGVTPDVVAEALDEIDAKAAAVDEYMPTDEEWAANPWATRAATDDGGEMWLFGKEPELGTAVWWPVDNSGCASIRFTTPPADFRTTLRHRPANI